MPNRITTNPGGEVGTFGPQWINVGGMAAVISTATVHTGNYAFRCESEGDVVGEGIQRASNYSSAATPGESLELKIWVFCTIAHSYRIGWKELPSNIDNSGLVAHPGGLSWVELIYTGVVGAGATEVQPFIKTGSIDALLYFVDDTFLDLSANITLPLGSRLNTDVVEGSALGTSLNTRVVAGAALGTKLNTDHV